MAVKAQSTITLARTDDGKTSYVHTAYKMPDGTFTKVLPGENLSLDTSSEFKEITVGAWDGLFLTSNVSTKVVPGEKYVASVYFDTVTTNVTQARINIRSVINGKPNEIGTIDIPSNGLSTVVKSGQKGLSIHGITVPEGVSEIAPSIKVGYISGKTNNILRYKGLKLERGSTATPYTPSPQDDPINAYPAKEGTYSDFNAEGSDNPDDYVWKPFNVVSQVEWQEKISRYDTALEPDNITASVTTSKTWEKFKQDEIDSKADKETVDGMGSELSNVGGLLNATQKQVGQMQIQSDKITQSIQTVTETVTAQGAVVKDVTDYMSFKTTGLEIGKSDSPFKTNLSNDELAFLENDEKVSYINGRTQHITKVEVTEEFRIGNHVAKKDEETGQTIFYWKG